MEIRTFDELVLYMRQRRVIGYRPPVLLLGAGASIDAGIGTMKQLFDFAKVKDFKAFSQFIKTRSADERYIYFSEFLQTQRPADVTPGYRALASLLAENYFDLILSTNFDPLLEDALADARLWRKDYILLVNGVIRPESLDLILKEPSPRVKIIKMHGDLFHRQMAWTEEEMAAFAKGIKPQLTPVLYGRDLFIIGYSLSDKPIRDLIVKAGGPNSTIWYLHPKEVPKSLQTNNRVRAVLGEECKFEVLFPKLVQGLDVEQFIPTAPKSAKFISREKTTIQTGKKQRTIDDLMASVVGLLPLNGSRSEPVGTGFILSEPRMIIVDGYVGKRFKEDKIRIVTYDKRTLEAKQIGRDQSHPFAPIFFKVPEGLNTPGLQLDVDEHPLKAGMAIRVGVAAGEQVGISSGIIAEVAEQNLEIRPVGMVHQLIAVQCTVAPGSSGAPVVDAGSLAVKGFIVAGNTESPHSFMYPAYRWANALKRYNVSILGEMAEDSVTPLDE